MSVIPILQALGRGAVYAGGAAIAGDAAVHAVSAPGGPFSGGSGRMHFVDDDEDAGEHAELLA